MVIADKYVPSASLCRFSPGIAIAPVLGTRTNRSGHNISALTARASDHAPQPETGKTDQQQPWGKSDNDRVQMEQQAGIGNDLIEQIDADSQHCREHQPVAEPCPDRAEYERNREQQHCDSCERPSDLSA